MSTRGRCQGLLTIARLNWPFYAAAALLLASACVMFAVVPAAGVRVACAFAAAGCVWFLAGSLAVSHLVYDRSDLYRWRWLERALGGAEGGAFVLCHAGFDDVSESLRLRLRPGLWLVLDHFDPARMTEPSIRRARRLFPPVSGTIAAPFDRWPAQAETADAILGVLAIHELRGESERTAWFAEARRCLHAGGRIVLAEHTRDFANFLAFGPGFLHFHSPASWRRCWERAGLRLRDEFRVTPWVRVFILSLA